jgi:uncharacterized coiled-coil protein SlyX
MPTRPDPTHLPTGEAIAVLTERVGTLATAVEELTSEVKGIPQRVETIEVHDAEQDRRIDCLDDALDSIAAAQHKFLTEVDARMDTLKKLATAATAAVPVIWVVFQILDRLGVF